MEQVVLCVSPGTAIPKTVLLALAAGSKKKEAHVFNPTCKVEAGVAKAQVKAYPKQYFIVTPENEKGIDVAAYPINKSFQRKEVDLVLANLNSEELMAVIEFAETLQGGEPRKAGSQTLGKHFDILTQQVEALEKENAELKEVIESAAPVTQQYEKWTMDALKEEAAAREIEVPAGSKKEDLVELLKK